MTKLVISSMDLPWEWGLYLGQYECAGEHLGAPYYRQTGDGRIPLYLYRDAQPRPRGELEMSLDQLRMVTVPSTIPPPPGTLRPSLGGSILMMISTMMTPAWC